MGLTMLSKLEQKVEKKHICVSCGNGDPEKLALNFDSNSIVCMNCGNKYPA